MIITPVLSTALQSSLGVAMPDGSDGEGDLKSFVRRITDDPAGVKSLTDAILLVLLEGISCQNTRLANTSGCMHNAETQTSN